MTDYIEIETTPTDEDCVQVSSSKPYFEDMQEEAYRYLFMLKRRFPFALEIFRIKRCEHDFGTHLQIKILYQTSDSGDSRSEYLAYFIENNLPEKWTDEKVFTMDEFNEYLAMEDYQINQIGL